MTATTARFFVHITELGSRRARTPKLVGLGADIPHMMVACLYLIGVLWIGLIIFVAWVYPEEPAKQIAHGRS
jgi:hypothetical protein